VGADKVWAALPLLEYDSSVAPAIEWAFGNAFICKDTDTATKVAYHPRIQVRCITLDGDSMDPGGTVSGGSAPKAGASVLNHIDNLHSARKTCETGKAELQRVEQEMSGLHQVAGKYHALKQQVDLKRTELSLLEERLRQTTHHQHQEEVDRLKVAI
ncbi:hypothetical protein J437_LFUL014385, partial [Ladona fulva]